MIHLSGCPATNWNYWYTENTCLKIQKNWPFTNVARGHSANIFSQWCYFRLYQVDPNSFYFKWNHLFFNEYSDSRDKIKIFHLTCIMPNFKFPNNLKFSVKNNTYRPHNAWNFLVTTNEWNSLRDFSDFLKNFQILAACFWLHLNCQISKRAYYNYNVCQKYPNSKITLKIWVVKKIFRNNILVFHKLFDCEFRIDLDDDI